MDVETDKIASAVEAADGGLLRRRVGKPGEVYPVKALLGVMAPVDVPDAEIDAYVDAFVVPEDDADEEAGPAHEFAELGVGRIRYAARSGEGTAVVLVHGFGGDLDNWLFNIDAIAEAAPVYALDLPGHGQSTKIVDEPGPDTMVDALVQLMDHLGLESAHLVGHSLGGLVAGLVAINHPGRAASLTLVCPAGLGEEINAGYIEGFVSADSRRDLKPVLGNLFADAGLVSRSLVDDLLKYKRLDGVGAFLGKLRDSVFPGGRQARSIASEVGELGIPVQVVWGSEDAIIPKTHADAVKGADVTVVDGAGHMVQMESAAQVNELVKKLL